MYTARCRNTSTTLSRPSYLQQSSYDLYEYEHYNVFVGHALAIPYGAVRLYKSEYREVAECFVALDVEVSLQLLSVCQGTLQSDQLHHLINHELSCLDGFSFHSECHLRFVHQYRRCNGVSTVPSCYLGCLLELHLQLHL